jgi:hypothetical protein
MKQIFALPLAALVIAIAASGAAAQEFQERVIDLPKTVGKWHLTAVYFSLDTPSVADRRLQESLRNHPGLRSLQSQVVVHEYDNSTPLIRTNEWATYLGNLRPALLLQAPHDTDGGGNVVYFASGRHLQTGDRLARSLRFALDNYRRVNGYTTCANDGCPCDVCDCLDCNDQCDCVTKLGQRRVCPRCPSPTPSPEPVSPAPAPAPIPQTVPELPLDDSAESDYYVPLWAFAFPFLGVAAGLYAALKRDARAHAGDGGDDLEDDD